MIRHGVVAALILAVPVLSAAQTDAPSDDARRHYREGLQHETRRDLDAARRSYEESVRQDPTFALALDRLGFVYGLQGNTARAIAEFERATKADPTLFDAFYHLGATQWWAGDAERAVEALRTAVRLQPDHAEARYYLGISLNARRPARRRSFIMPSVRSQR